MFGVCLARVGRAAARYLGYDKPYSFRRARTPSPRAMVPSIVMIRQEYGIAKTIAR